MHRGRYDRVSYADKREKDKFIFRIYDHGLLRDLCLSIRIIVIYSVEK